MLISLPTGIVTFLFVDLESGTRQGDTMSEDMPAALKRQDAILRDAVQSNGGVVFKTAGNASYTAFPTALNAVAAALAAQHELANQDWGGIPRLPLRMALHTGVAELRDGDYYGPPLDRVAGILAACKDGQILM